MGLSKLVISRVIIRPTPSRALITLLITYLRSLLPLQVGPMGLGAYYGLVFWEFPKIRGTLFWGPYNRDPNI